MKMFQINCARVVAVALAMVLVLGLVACSKQPAASRNDTPGLEQGNVQQPQNSETTDNTQTMNPSDDVEQSTGNPFVDGVDVDSWPGFSDSDYGIKLPIDEHAFD